MPSVCQYLRRRQRDLHHAAGRDKRDIGSRALDIGDAKGNGIITLRHRPFQLVHHLIFEENDRIIVADRRFQQPFGVVGCRGQRRPSGREHG